MLWSKSLLQRLRVARALNRTNEYPKVLPNPELTTVSPREKKIVDELKSVCLFLGPYRNLTTLTASLLFLHPNCQVLNHAGSRILPNERLNFFSGYTAEKFRDFCHFSIVMSQGGARGSYGGSIVLSHAFADHEDMRQIFKNRFGSNLLKSNIKSLVWKESELLGQFMRRNSIDLATIFGKNPKLRFLMPIRNPVNCAQSIVRYGMNRHYQHLIKFDLEHVLNAVFEELRWFVDLKSQFPNRFHYFFQDQLGEGEFRLLANFLGLDADPRWLKDVRMIYLAKSNYAYKPDLFSYLDDQLDVHFGDLPSLRHRLRDMIFFAEGSEPDAAAQGAD